MIFIKILKQAAALLLVLILSVCAMTYFYEYTDKDTHMQAVVGYTRYKDNVYIDDSCTNEALESITNFMELMPDAMTSYFYEQGWNVIIAESPPQSLMKAIQLEDNGNYDRNVFNVLGGITVPKVKTLYVSTITEKPSDIFVNFIHEYGHFIDYEFGYLDKADDFQQFYAKYSGLEYVYNDYETSDSSEFFAASFAKFMTEKSSVIKNTPEINTYFSSVLKKTSPHASLLDRIKINTIGLLRLAKFNLQVIIRKVKLNFNSTL